jgi:hypothetical protein
VLRRTAISFRDTAHVSAILVSPTAEEIAYVSTTKVHDTSGPWSVSPDGGKLLCSTSAGHSTISSLDGTGTDLDLGVAGECTFSPDSKHVACIEHLEDFTRRDLSVYSVATGARTRVLKDVRAFTWSPGSDRIAALRKDCSLVRVDTLVTSDPPVTTLVTYPLCTAVPRLAWR